MTDCLFITPS